MKIRAYHADSVESAIRQARLELGEEAMLLDSRKASADSRHLGLYEVRFVVGEDGVQKGPPAPPQQASRKGSEGLQVPAATRLAELSQGIEEIRRMLYSCNYTPYLPPGELLSQPQLAQIYYELMASEVGTEFAVQLVAGLNATAARGASRAEIEQKLVEALQALITVSDEIGRGGGRPRMVALVGPTGAGKTTTLAKLAVQCGLRRRSTVHLLSADSYRVGAVEQLETYAEILGVDWTAAEDLTELRSTLDSFQKPEGQPDLVLIDTPGYAFSELERSAELAEFLISRADIDTHLVVGASTRPKDLRRIIEKYRAFGPRKLLFTRLDETLSFGPLLNEAIRTQWPLSFLGIGQRVPEDLIVATKSTVADLILYREARSAAHSGSANAGN